MTAATRNLVEKKFSAVEWVKAVAPLVQGGGGGRPDMAKPAAGSCRSTRRNRAAKYLAEARLTTPFEFSIEIAARSQKIEV